MKEEEFSQLWRSDHIVHKDEDALFTEMIHDHQDCGVSGGDQELFNEVHGDRVPWLQRDGELFQESVWLMPWNLCMHTSGAQGDILFDESPYSWPGVFIAYEFQGLVLSEMSGERVIMLVAKNMKAEVVGVRDIDMVV